MTPGFRGFALGATIVLVAGCAGGDGSSVPLATDGAAQRRTPDNVIVIVVDALRPDHLGTYGHHRDTTPELDRFAAANLVFDRAYAATSWTLPSLASFMAGVYPSIHGLRSSPDEPDHNRLPPGFLTLAESLGRQGFATASISSQPWISDRTGLTQGFDEVRTVSDASDPREASILTDALIEWIGTPRSEPFFLYAHYMGPHSPYAAPPTHAGRYSDSLTITPAVRRFHELYEKENAFNAYAGIIAEAQRGLSSDDIAYLEAEYDEKLAFTDQQLGRLLDAVESLGLLETTAIVITADHGEAFYEHETIFHGQQIHEELIRVPLIAHLPGDAPVRGRFDAVVELVDLYPTFHDLLGLPYPGYVQGSSLLPVIDGGPGDGIAFAEGFGFKVITPGWSSLFEYDDLSRQEGLPVRQLYDLSQDPFEQVNLAGTRPKVEAEQREIALAIWSEIWETSTYFEDAAQPADLDAETREKLESLGYLQ